MPQMSAHDVAAELRRQLPGVGVKKLHKLLYYCQGHHLAHFDQPLFHESVMAYDMGPLVAQLWWFEKIRGIANGTRPLDNGQQNTVAYVVSRYGGLSSTDLQRLTHSEPPWQMADRNREAGTSVRMDPAEMKEFFDGDDVIDDDVPWPSREVVSKWLAGAEMRRPGPGLPDDRNKLLARLAASA